MNQLQLLYHYHTAAAVQRQAAHFILSRYRNTSCVNSLLEALDWPTLERCHQISRLSRLYKIHSGLVHCPSLQLQAKLPPTPLASTEAMKGSSGSSQQQHSTGVPHSYPEPSRTGTACPRKQLSNLRPPRLRLFCHGPPPYKPSGSQHTPPPIPPYF